MGYDGFTTLDQLLETIARKHGTLDPDEKVAIIQWIWIDGPKDVMEE